MKTSTRAARNAPMSADAYAGFLKLLLTPASKVPTITPDIAAYLRYVGETEPLSDESRRALGQQTVQAA